MAAEVDQSSELSEMSSINVTPFVDVVLVLLIIFIVTAPTLLKDAIEVKLPKSASVDTKSIQSIGITVTQSGQILLAGKPVTEEALNEAVKAALAANPDANAIIAADREARHGDVVRAIDLIKSAGLNRFALQIER